MQSPPPPPPPGPQPYQPPSALENGGYSPGPKSSPILIFLLSFSHNITQILIGGVVVSALVMPNIYTLLDSFVQHVILCTVGYFILMSQAILSISPFGYATHLGPNSKILIHAAMQISGSILAITGSIIRIADRDTNFDTAHGICGIIAMIPAVLTLIGGVLSLIFRNMNNDLLKILHTLVGAITLIIAYIAVILAFHNYYRDAMGDGNANLAVVFSVFALAGTLLMAAVSIVKRVLKL